MESLSRFSLVILVTLSCVIPGYWGQFGHSSSSQFFTREFGGPRPFSFAHSEDFSDIFSNAHPNYHRTETRAPERYVQSEGFKPSMGVFEHQGEIIQVKSCPPFESRKSYCQTYSRCALYLPEILATAGTVVLCTTETGESGMCCPIIKKNADVPAPQITPPYQANPEYAHRLFSSAAIEDAIEHSRHYEKEFDYFESNILNSSVVPRPFTASHGHLVFSRTSNRAIKIARTGNNLIQITKSLLQGHPSYDHNPTDAIDELRGISVQTSSIGGQCPAPLACDPTQNGYRTVDGTCNNLQNPRWGAVFNTHIRVARPDYADGVYAPRVSVTGLELPSPRLLSTTIAPDVNNPNPYYTQWTMQFGQFVNHDMTHQPFHRFANGSGIECCSPDGDFLPPDQTHPFCLPIEIPADDRFYAPLGQRCMNFVRSMVGPRPDCTLGYADQLSQITAHLDNSNIYASTREEHDALREFRFGRLRTDRPLSQTPRGYQGLLPMQTSANSQDMCTDPGQGTFCFRAGDLRSNQVISLTLTHTIWLREHNRVAGVLSKLNPLWTDDRLFNEARRIVNAEYQHIIFNEFLPVIIGRNYMETYGILPQADGYYRGYDPNTNPQISQSFAVAAYRMGHSLIQGILPLITGRGEVQSELVLHDYFNNPFALRQQGFVDNLLRGLSHSTMQNFDRWFTSEVTNRLFQPPNATFGLDLVSLNIQRGRDHGIPSYNRFRELCQLGRASRFEDFADWMTPAAAQKLANLYDNPDDVDLYVGGILERPVPGALIGPTFLCIVGDQFARSRRGDRFAYDSGPGPQAFTRPQLQEIRRASYARIICDNGDAIQNLQPFAFLIANSEYNPIVSCDSNAIPHVDLSPWKVECSTLFCDK